MGLQYLVLSLGEAKHVTHAVPKTLNPEWNEHCQLPINGVSNLLLDVICWDKDRFGKDYLGEFDLALEEIFANEKTEQEPRWFSLRSKRPGKKTSLVSGEVLLQFRLLDTTNKDATPQQTFERFLAIASSFPAAESMSRNQTPSLTPILAPTHYPSPGQSPGSCAPVSRRPTDDEEDEYDEYEEEAQEYEDMSKPENAERRRRRLRIRRLKARKRQNPYEFNNGGSDVVGIIFLEICHITDLPPESNITKTSFDMDPFVVASLGKKTYRTKTVWHNLNPVYNEKMLFQIFGHEQSYSFSFTVIDKDKYSGNDFIASVNLPVKELIDRAPEANLETGLYDLPTPPEYVPNQRPRFIKLGMSRATSATNVSKTGKPTLARTGSNLSNYASIVSTANNSAGSTLHPVDSSPDTAPQLVDTPGHLAPAELPVVAAAYAAGETSPPDSAESDFHVFALPLKMKNLEKWEDKHNPQLFVRAKYMPYPALRQQFWRAVLKQYDTDESGRISKVELTTMLDTLGSTLRESTIDGFFKRLGPNGSEEVEDMSFDEAVICLEDQLDSKGRPAQTVTERVKGMLPDTDKIKALFSTSGKGSESAPPEAPAASFSDGSVAPSESLLGQEPTILVPKHSAAGEEGDTLEKDDLNAGSAEEHVIEIRECPICHQPRLNKRKDADIITHIATCASQDWRQVNNLMMGGFVTASQAQRKWYSKVITKVTYGGYRLGANSANILVQDRLTGQITEEKMSMYVRLGIRLLYKGLKSRDMEAKRSMLKFSQSLLNVPTLTHYFSSTIAQKSKHQAREEIRRPCFQGRDSEVHRISWSRHVRSSTSSGRLQELQRILLPRPKARCPALLGPGQPTHRRLTGRLPECGLQPHRDGAKGVDQGPRVQRPAVAG